jgi:steroid 5-alpha reductase family enzyme
MLLAWLVHLAQKKASVIDSFWGPGFAVIGWFSFYAGQGDPWRKALLAVLATIWAVRLCWHITARSIGEPEDRRYAAMRANHPRDFWIRSLFTVFLLQALIMWVVSLPLQLGMWAPSAKGLGWLDIVGLLLWLAGFFWEAVGDWQLTRFKADPANKGKILDYGLWRYTRHPNYFGESLMWWALFVIAASAPWGIWSFIGPLVITLSLLKVSGVTLTEKMMSEKHSDLNDYKKKTSAFFPLPPKEK